MTINLGIPQIIWLVTAVFGLIYEIINHDKPREPHNAYTFAISTVISFFAALLGRLLRINTYLFNSLFITTK